MDGKWDATRPQDLIGNSDMVSMLKSLSVI